MPYLDVSDVILDPDFCERIMVVSRAQETSDTGRDVLTETNQYFFAVVTMGGIEDYAIEDDKERAKQRITVHSQRRLREPAPGYAADIVVWNGNNYLVRKVYNYSHFGAGFYATECELTDTVLNAKGKC